MKKTEGVKGLGVSSEPSFLTIPVLPVGIEGSFCFFFKYFYVKCPWVTCKALIKKIYYYYYCDHHYY